MRTLYQVLRVDRMAHFPFVRPPWMRWGLPLEPPKLYTPWRTVMTAFGAGAPNKGRSPAVHKRNGALSSRGDARFNDDFLGDGTTGYICDGGHWLLAGAYSTVASDDKVTMVACSCCKVSIALERMRSRHDQRFRWVSLLASCSRLLSEDEHCWQCHGRT